MNELGFVSVVISRDLIPRAQCHSLRLSLSYLTSFSLPFSLATWMFILSLLLLPLLVPSRQHVPQRVFSVFLED